MRVELDDGEMSEHSAVTKYRLMFDENGWVVRRTFFNPYGRPIRDAEGSYGETIERNDLGVVVSRYQLDENGERLSRRNGTAGQHFRVSGDIVEAVWVNVQGKAVLGPSAWSKKSLSLILREIR